MDAPGALREAADGEADVTISHREYDDGTVVAVDFGPGVDATLDVVGDTAIVVAGDRQYEFEIPPAATDVLVTDGVVTIESESAGSESTGGESAAGESAESERTGTE